MNMPRASRFQPEREFKAQSDADKLDDLGGESLDDESGFEDEVPEIDFEERS
jgi:hypothetical protein